MSATLKNTQAMPLSISSIAISGGTAPGDYVAGGNCPLRPSTLGPGENCNITVTFTPSALGIRTATLTVKEDVATSPLSVALTGTGLAPVDPTPSSESFRAVAVGNTSGTQSGTLSNQQNGAGPSSGVTPSEDFELSRPGTLTPPSRASGSPGVIPVSGPGNANGLSSITVTPANPSIALGQMQQFTATGHFRNGSRQNLTASVLWNSSAPGVATINAAGLASSVAAGSMTITATFLTVTPFGPARGGTPGTPIINSPPPAPISGSTMLTVTAPPLTVITTSPLPAGTEFVGYSQAITATGGHGTYTFTIVTPGTGTLPAGLNLSTSGYITGTPTGPNGPSTFTVQVSDQSNPVQMATANFSLTINLPAAPSITTTSALPAGTEFVGYSQAIAATGGHGTYTFTIVTPGTGTLPAGLNLSTSGYITGTPTGPNGPSTFTVQVSDQSNPVQTATASFSLTVNLPLAPTISPASLPNGTVGTSYNQTLTVSGGHAPFTFSVSGGALPAGLTLSPLTPTSGTTATISGQPTTQQSNVAFTILVTDSSNPAQTGSQGYTVTIAVALPLGITTTLLPSGVVNTFYTTTLTAVGGTAPLTWSNTGTLPAGLSLNSSTGVISGTPTTAGTWSFTVQVADSTMPTALTATQGLSLTTNWTPQALSITTTALPDGTVGVAYSAAVNATGGTGVYTWSIVSGGTFPPCLSLSATTGFISGAPVNTCLGAFSFSVMVTDSASNSATRELSINTNPALPTVCESGNESVLKGQYAFNLSGYNSGGFNTVVGSMTANGAGHITGGEVDMNSAGASSATNSTISAYPASYYSVGADNRGCATIATASGATFTTRFELGAISSGTATQGRIIEFDPANSSAFIATGQIFQQTTSTTPSASNFSALNGGYVHLLTGWDSSHSTRIACAGVDTYSSPYVSNSEQDCNDGGNFVTTGPYSGNVGTYTSTDQYGRFTETVGTYVVAAYMVSAAATGAVVVTTSIGGSNLTVMAGQAFQQSGSPYGLGSLNSPVVAFANGLYTSTSGKIQFALDHANGAGTFTTDAYYENDGGTWTWNGTTGTCTYTVASNGRVSGCGWPTYLMYLTAANTAVVVNNDSGVFAGYVMPQTVPNSGFTPALIAGTFFGGTSEIVNPSPQAEGGMVTLLSGSGTALSGTSVSDETSTTYQQADDLETISGATLGSNGTITETQNSTSQVIGVGVDTTHFLMVNNPSSSYPTLLVFGPSTADTVAVTITSPATAQSVAANGGFFGIIVNVAGTTSSGVTWTFNGLPSGSGYGTMSGSYPTFTYTAPPRLPNPATFSITATSNADVSKSASLSVTITAGVGTQPLSITTTSLPSSTGGAAYVQNIQTSGGTLPIVWSVTSGSLPPGLGLQCTPNGVGTITGIPTASGSYTFTVTASDASTPTQYASQQFTIVVTNVPLRITTTALPRGTLGPAYSAAVAVSGGTMPYTWGLTGGALPGWATLNTSSGAITGTPGGTGTANFTVTVTDSTSPTHQTANQSLSITISGLPPTCSGAPTGNESMLDGQYAFLVQGSWFAIAASFHADGAGNVTGGDFDINNGTATHATIDASSYAVGLDSTSSGNLGCVALSLSNGSTTVFRFSLGGLSSGVFSKGRIIEFDDATGFGEHASGVLRLQDTTSFSLSQLQPNYAFGVDGFDSYGYHYASAGSFSVNTSGNISNAFDDTREYISGNSETTGGTGTIDAISTASGRATMSLTLGGQTTNQAAYLVNADEFFIVGTDPLSSVPIYSGRAIVTASSFSQSSLSGNYIIHTTAADNLNTCTVLTGGDTYDVPCTTVRLWLVNANSGAYSGTMYFYSPSPAVMIPAPFSGDTYAVDATSGRTTISCADCVAPVFYIATPTAMTEPISAFSLGPTVYADFGFMEFQPSATYSTSGMAGNYLYGTEDPGDSTVTNEIGVLSVSSGGTVSGSEYDSGDAGLEAGSASATLSMGSNGVGSWTFPIGEGCQSTNVAITNGTRIFVISRGGGYCNGIPLFPTAVVTVFELQ